MSPYVLTDRRLRYQIEYAVYEWAKERLGSGCDWKTLHYFSKGANATTRLALNRMLGGKELPTKPTKSQAQYGIHEADLPELHQLVFTAIDEHLQKVVADLDSTLDLYSPAAKEQLLAALHPVS